MKHYYIQTAHPLKQHICVEAESLRDAIKQAERQVPTQTIISVTDISSRPVNADESGEKGWVS